MKHRVAARVIGVTSVVYSIVNTVINIVIIFLVAYATSQDSQHPHDPGDERELAINIDNTYSPRMHSTFLWILIALLCGSIVLQILAFWKLIKGTTKGVDAEEGLHFCDTWRVITVIFVIMQLIWCISLFVKAITAVQFVSGLANLFLNVVALCIVQSYMKKLESPLPKSESVSLKLEEVT